ncbi:hypothetical protein PV433_10850 [Paenibacillus sp. GYB004]|uniref:Qat anti-phage system associated protein QatB n=1 Tax=Paenibacillus sp. GYB004 TaxID=2994393 RepID=UPI002F967D27
MGTSSSYGGLTGGNKLLPPWAQEPDSPPEPDLTPADEDGQDQAGEKNEDVELPAKEEPGVPKWVRMESWRAPKGMMRRYASNKGNLNRTGRAYVRSKGGAKTAAKNAVAGKSATARLGGFLSDIARNGFLQAFDNLGLRQVIGQPVEAVFAAIAQALTPMGATLEDHIARRAVNDAMADLFQKFGADDDLNQIDQMNEDGVRDAIKDCVQNYIYQRWLQELGDRIEKHAMSAEQAIRMERDVKAYVKEAVKLDLSKVDVLGMDWNGPQIGQIMDAIYTDAYSMLEVSE